MATPNKYRSVFTGNQIDEILASVKTKLDSSLIVNDYTGGPTKIASAEIVKTLYDNVQSFKDPNYFQYLFLQIPDSNIFTTAEKQKLATFSVKFVGSFLDAATRDASVVTTNYTGGEFAFLVSDGNGYQEISMWDTSTNTWKKTQLYNIGLVPTTSVPTATTVSITSLDTTKFSTCKFVVTAKNALLIQTQEVMLTTNGTDDFISVYGEVGNSSTLFSIATSKVGNIIYINATTTVSSTTIYAKKTVEI